MARICCTAATACCRSVNRSKTLFLRISQPSLLACEPGHARASLTCNRTLRRGGPEQAMPICAVGLLTAAPLGNTARRAAARIGRSCFRRRACEAALFPISRPVIRPAERRGRRCNHPCPRRRCTRCGSPRTGANQGEPDAAAAPPGSERVTRADVKLLLGFDGGAARWKGAVHERETGKRDAGEGVDADAPV